MTKTERIHMAYAQEVQAAITADVPDSVPAAWHDIWRERDRRDIATERVTLRLDADVVRFFRSMGKGYQPRMNRVLKSYMHHRLAGLVAGPEDCVTRQEAAAQQEAERLAASLRAALERTKPA